MRTLTIRNACVTVLLMWLHRAAAVCALANPTESERNNNMPTAEMQDIKLDDLVKELSASMKDEPNECQNYIETSMSFQPLNMHAA